MLRGEKGKTFLVQFPGPTANNLKFCRTFGRTILVTSGVSKKTLTKSHGYSRLFYLEKYRLEITFLFHSSLFPLEVCQIFSNVVFEEPSVQYLETLAKILDFPANSRYLLKPLIRS